MSAHEANCVDSFARMCSAACARGWHEANGGNLSYLMSESDLAALDVPLSSDGTWRELASPVPSLAGAFVMMTASGAYLSNVERAPQNAIGIIEIDDAGKAWRIAWGFEGGARPSSELETHLAAYEAAAQTPASACRVVYHAHCPQVIALSAVLEADSRLWTRVLWKIMTETIAVFPEGVGVVPWMVPGSPELARATIELMRTHRVCVWTNHGIMTRAESFDEAFGQIETIEKAAGIYLQARAACGGEEPRNLVTDDQLRAICERYGLRANEDFLD